MTRGKNTSAFFANLLFALLLLLGAYFVLSNIWSGLVHLSDTSRTAIIASALTVCLGIYSHYKNRQREIEQALYEKKQPVYESLMSFIFNLMNLSKKEETMSEEKMAEFFADFSRQLILW